MDFFYDGQIRRYVTQFMRIFIGFKYQSGDGDLMSVPVTYGDMTRQVAAIIRENSENKLPSVPKIACYITGLELDRTRLADATYVSKINIQERDYLRPSDSGYNEDVREYTNSKGNSYTVERLMPTPFVLKMKADIWTSNTDQKLQLLEQILVLFNPSIELQTTDNYIDWTSLSVVDLETTNFSSRSIPAGADSDIDICSLEFKMPVYITPPAKVKKMGVIRDVIMNVFDANGDVGTLNSLIYNGEVLFRSSKSIGNFGALLMSANIPGPENRNRFRVSVLNPNEAVTELGLEPAIKRGERLDWNLIIQKYDGKHIDGISTIYFKQPSGLEIFGRFSIMPLDPTFLDVEMDLDTIPVSTTNVNAIINPLTFNPRPDLNALPVDGANSRYLLIDDIGGGIDQTFITDRTITVLDTGVPYSKVYEDQELDTGGNVTTQPMKQPVENGLLPRFEVFANGILVAGTAVPPNSENSNLRILLDLPINHGSTVRYKVYVNFDGSDAWATYLKNQPASETSKTSELIAKTNSIVEFDSNLNGWKVVFDPSNYQGNLPLYITNGKTGVQYKWDGQQWLKSFEGEYRAGTWRFNFS